MAHVFADAYFTTYKKILEAKEEKSKEIDELIKNKIKSQFIDIEKKIDDYLQRLKEEEKKKRRKNRNLKKDLKMGLCLVELVYFNLNK